jgi:hypothetical protein
MNGRGRTWVFAVVLSAGCWAGVSAIRATPVAAQAGGILGDDATIDIPAGDPSIFSFLISGRAGGSWNSADADSLSTLVSGLPSGEAEINYLLYADANAEGVRGDDFEILIGNLGNFLSGWDDGNFDLNGTTNPTANIAAIDAFAAANGLTADVPEPATMALLGVGAAAILRRRRFSQI